MVLNYIWVSFFIIAFIVGLVRLIFMGDAGIFPEMMNSTFDMAKTGFEISLGLTGVMTLWMGLMKVGEKGGIVNLMSRAVWAALQPPVPRNPERASGQRFDYDEHRRQYAGPRQCRYPAGAESHDGASGTEQG